MNVIQIIHHLSYGDGMSNTLFIINRVLDKFNITHTIITLGCDSRIERKDIIVLDNFNNYKFSDDDLVLYHYGVGGEFNICAENLNCKKILVFHNVTYPHLFREWNYNSYQRCLAGEEDIKYTKDKYIYAITLSEFSKQTLISAGWDSSKISIFPLYEIPNIDSDYDKETFEKYNDGSINFIFTGRISPHKKIEDVINIFNFYNKNQNNKSRLFLVGSFDLENYKRALDDYIADNHINNVIFTGHVSNASRNAYYRLSDIFICTSEHEGFCIPILEAFQRKIPVIAYNTTALPDTMGNAGILVNSKAPELVCKEIVKLCSDNSYKQSIIEKQLNRLKEMTLEAHKDEFIECLKMCFLLPKINQTSQNTQLLKVPVLVSTQKQSPLLQDNFINIIKQCKNNGIVLYGYGKVGKQMLSYLDSMQDVNIVAVCDNNSEELQANEYTIISHNQAVENFPNADYLITVQKDFLEIVFALKNDGIADEHIILYDSIRHTLQMRGGGKCIVELIYLLLKQVSEKVLYKYLYL